MLFAKPDEWIEGHSEVVNDINGSLAVFWRVLQSDKNFKKFRRIVENTPFSEWEWRWAKNHVGMCPGYIPDAPLEAACFFTKYRQSRQGLGKNFATLSRTRTRRGMNEQVSSWLSAIEGLPEAHSRLKRVVILNDDAVKVIQQQDGPETFFYLDPPYLHETRVTTSDYEHEMSCDDHLKLLDTLRGIEGKFLLSGYRSTPYNDVARACGWTRHENVIDNKASSKKTKERKVECLWANF